MSRSWRRARSSAWKPATTAPTVMCSPPGGCSALWALGPYRRTGPDAGLYSALNICPRPRRAPSPNIEDFSYPPAARLLLYSRRPAGRGQCFFFPPEVTAGVLTKGLIPLSRQPHHLTPAAGRLQIGRAHV